MKLIIKGLELELTPNQNISRTLQVNDILTLSNRQSNYSNTFSIKRTDKNKQVFQLLGVPSITNFMPYELNECYLYTDDGECMVYKGRAVIQSTDNEYKINIYDGNIDLYKAIENKNLGELDLTEIDHTKNLASVVNTFTANLNYKYLIADYNGEMIYNTNRINIDYLVPSAKVSYLWNKIFDTYGFTYSGSVFNTVDFTNLWLSYPKFGEITQTPTEIFNVTTSVETQPVFPTFIAAETGTYRIDGNNIIQPSITYQITDWAGMGIGSYTTNTVYIYVNGILVANYNESPIDLILNIGDVVTMAYEEPFVNNGESFGVNYVSSFQSQLIVSIFTGVPISFTNELKDFGTKDFITEILNRFGLTPFKDKYTNHYTFKTLQELLQDNQVIDWSRDKNKFTEFVSESYVFGSYAQQNKLTYKYNDIESDYYNSEILINNVNLADTKTVVNSRIFAPEREQTKLIHNLDCNVYKMWDKEVQDNGDVKYKGLQKRYYLMRERSHTFTTTTQIGSKVLGTHQDIETIPVETFYNLPMQKIVQNYYSTIGAILNYSKLVKAKIYLTEKNISDIDFSKLYWIKQLNGYFLLNKVNNFTKKGITNVELIKVDYAAPTLGQPVLLIDEVRNLTPRIHFGFNQPIATVTAGTQVSIYQDTIYNPDVYNLPLPPFGPIVISNSLNEIVVRFDTPGVYPISIVQTNKDKTITLNSNEITLTVI